MRLGSLALGTGLVLFVTPPPSLIERVRAEVGQGDLWWSSPAVRSLSTLCEPWGRGAKNVLGDESGLAELLQEPTGTWFDPWSRLPEQYLVLELR